MKGFKPSNLKITKPPPEEKEEPLSWFDEKTDSPFSAKEKSPNLKMEDLKRISKIGEGNFGEVFKVIHKRTGKKYAQKVLKLDFKKDENSESVERELRLLSQIENEHIIKLESFEIDRSENKVYMLLEFMNIGSIDRILKLCGAFSEQVISQICVQVLKALQYLQEEKQIVHRDLKPANLLFNDKGICKLSDFGMANDIKTKRNNGLLNTFLGSLHYMSPERVKGQGHSFVSDIWSLGLLALEMRLGEYPFDIKDNNFFDLISIVEKKIQEKEIFPSSKENKTENEECYSKEFRSFIEQCLTIDSKERPDSVQLLNHPFITKYTNSHPSLRAWLHNGFIKKIKIIEKKKRELKKKKKE